MIFGAFIALMLPFTSAFIPQYISYKTPSSQIIMNGKGFGGGEATRDPNPSSYDLNDPKGKQTAIFKAETYAEYLARRNPANTHGAQTGALTEQPEVNNQRSGLRENAESYAEYMAKRKAAYKNKFGTSDISYN